MTDQFCNNCGNYGHVFYQCKRPITSIGIIAFRKNSEEKLEYLMIQRKDSLGFVEFIRGKYNIQNVFHLRNLFKEITTNERVMLSTMNFSELWTYLWGEQNNKINNEYSISIEKFNILKNGVTTACETYNLESLLSEIKTNWIEPEWGFPKGRRNYQEKDLECAIREFVEETGISKNNLQIIENLYTVEEIFTGSNLKSYKHKYYIAKINNTNEIDMNNYQKSEIGDMKWLSYEKCIEYIRPYNFEKINELSKINKMLSIYRLSI